MPELIDDERFATSQARSANHGELEPLLNEAFLKRTTDEWITALQQYGMPCGPLNDIPSAAAMPQVAAREMLVPVPHHTIGEMLLPNTPVKLSRTPGGIKGTSPDMGQDTREVMSELLGLDRDEIEALLAREVLHEERAPVDLG